MPPLWLWLPGLLVLEIVSAAAMWLAQQWCLERRAGKVGGRHETLAVFISWPIGPAVLMAEGLWVLGLLSQGK